MNNNIQTIKPTGLFTNYIYKAIPLVFDESMSYYETLAGLLAFLKNTIIPTINNNAEIIKELEDYMNNYFQSDEIQNKVNIALDNMVKDGTFNKILQNYGVQKIYNNHHDMINANLSNGMSCKTLGYYEINDGGGADYIITDTKDDTKYQEQIENLYVEMILKDNTINLLTIGVNENNINNSNLINKVINKFNVSIDSDSINVSDSIILNTNNKKINFNCKLINNTNNDLLIIKSSYNTIFINSTETNGNSIVLDNTDNIIDYNDISFNQILSRKNGILLECNGNGSQYNNFYGNRLYGELNAIYIHKSSISNGWCNENRFYNINVQSNTSTGCAINLSDETTSANSNIAGNRFFNIGIEGTFKGIILDKASANYFYNTRTQENIKNFILTFTRGCFSNFINIDSLPLNKLDYQSTTGTNFINGMIFDNDTNYLTISDKIIGFVNSYTINPLYPLQLNTFLISDNDITLSPINQNGYFTNILMKDNATIRLSSYYLSNSRIGQTMIFTSGVNSTLKDNNDNDIISASESQYQNYKKIAITLLGRDVANNKWLFKKELL